MFWDVDSILTTLGETWPAVAAVLTFLLSLITSAHIVLYKSDSRAAVGWVGVVWLAPVIGAVLYVLFGINRIRRRAALTRGYQTFETQVAQRPPQVLLPAQAESLLQLVAYGDRVAGHSLTMGNAITPLVNGDEAYPAMVAAIDLARSSVALSTYIFDHGPVGQSFLDALERAVHRGVTVRVLIDAVGARYSWPPIVRALKRRQIPVARFEHTIVPWRMPYMNLRNHRKLLIIDGTIGFTGGMNIREGSVLASQHPHPVQDLHFKIEGPVVAHLMEAFSEDWIFTTGEALDGIDWFPRLEDAGQAIARGITDGPDRDLDKAELTLLGALAAARSSVRIVTPYFLPDSRLISALNVTAMRGVAVEILLPQENNLALVQWASTAQLWQILRRGCCVFYTPPPFDHTKLMLVDDCWAFFGSSNWDPRSLRLNFEFDVECFDPDLVSTLDDLVERKLGTARPVTLQDVNARPLPIKLRDGVARLAAPYL
ncbi:MAG: cardiolipin synthase [Gemmatimonadales bacterium]|nr:MAG: cardiolipin synthase [Gemmatimonadales bacterium]